MRQTTLKHTTRLSVQVPRAQDPSRGLRFFLALKSFFLKGGGVAAVLVALAGLGPMPLVAGEAPSTLSSPLRGLGSDGAAADLPIDPATLSDLGESSSPGKAADAEPSREQLDMLARKVAELEARLLQLDALSKQLADMAGVRPESYEFKLLGGQGGPQIELVPMSYGQLSNEVLVLGERLADRVDFFAVLEARLADLVAHHELTPSRMPLEGYRYRSSSFGPRFDPINRRRSFHEGLDFAAPPGTPIYAAAAGVVRASRYFRGYGNMVEIDHGDDMITRYAHASRLLVEAGQLVQRGQKIATVGSTGRSTGPHLHFEVRIAGQAVDPRLYLAGGGSALSQSLARAD